jgi:protein NrfC
MAETEQKKPAESAKRDGVSRRTFIGTGAGLVVGGVAGGLIGSKVLTGDKFPNAPASFTELGAQKHVKNLLSTLPASKGYLLVDHKKCAGCLNCMMACAMAHTGQPGLSLSRIQITQDIFERYPNDLQQHQCRQCVSPACVLNCPTEACHIDTTNGNVRVIDESKCIGCKTCISSCPQQPHRTIWNPATSKASKCDLCIDAPFLGEKGGPGGKQACIAVCPMQAIKFTDVTPDQTGNAGYDVNLRNANAVKILLLDAPLSNK